MSDNHQIEVNYCVVDIRRRDKESESVFFESSFFVFQSSKCYLGITNGWESKERKVCKVYVKSQPSQLSKFYVTVCIFKGNHSISFPKKVVLDSSKPIWSAAFADIEKQVPGDERCNLNFRFTFQTEYEPERTLKSSGHKSVQTSSRIVNENDSLQKLSEDLSNLLEGRGPKYDIKLKSGDLVVGAHKAVIGARSEFFEKELQSVNGDQITLPKIDPAAFQANVQYMYTAKYPDLSFETAKKIVEAGSMCNHELLQRCVDFLIENLTPDNACECLELVGDHNFRERVIGYIIEKGIPYLDQYWKPFCLQHPKSANDVYYKLVRILLQSK